MLRMSKKKKIILCCVSIIDKILKERGNINVDDLILKITWPKKNLAKKIT